MYRLFFISAVLFFASVQVEAQRSNPPSERRNFVMVEMRGDQIQVERIAYFTEKIGLTTEEAQLFWPIYKEFDNKRNALFDERASIIQNFMNNADNFTEKQIDEQLKRLVAIQQQELALPAEYDAKFRKVLSARKVMNLYVAEIGFRNHLLQKMRNRPPPGSGNTK